MLLKLVDQTQLVQVNQILDEVHHHDVATFEHCVRVSHLCRFLAQAASLSMEDQIKAQFSGLLHDVGKAKIPLSILNKPGKLTESEYEIMKSHALLSAEMLEPLEEDPFFAQVQEAILHHHERADGRGYPLQLEGETIPYLSRVILIVDTVDAMTQTRAYRKGLPLDVVYRELEKFAGTQFDYDLVGIFIDAHKKAMEQSGNIIPIQFPLPVVA